MDSERLLKFIGYFPDYLSALSRRLLRFFWTTFVETVVYLLTREISCSTIPDWKGTCLYPTKLPPV